MGCLLHTLWSLILNGFIKWKLLLTSAIVFAAAKSVWRIIKPVYQSYKNAKELDEKAGPVPRHWFYGHHKEFGQSHDGLLRRARLTSSHPTMFNMWLAPFITTLSLHHSDTASTLLSSGAPKNELVYGFVRPWIGDGLLLSSGTKWLRHRRLLTPAFHFSVLKSYAAITNGCVDIMLDKWRSLKGRAFDVSNDVSLMTLDTMLKCAMSSETNCQNDRNHPFVHAVRELTKIIATRIQIPFLYPDFIFLRTSAGRQFTKYLDVVHSQGRQIIEERRAALKDELLRKPAANSDSSDDELGFNSKNRLDFLDILLQTKDEDGKGLTDTEIRDEVNTFLAAGSDTAASGISWGLYNLAKHPDIQEKCREEVMSVLEDRKNIEWRDLSKLSYLTMCIKESMRLNPPVYAFGKQLQEPLTLRSTLNKVYETVVPKGAISGLSIFALHRNETMWENHLEFDPERFTKENIAKRPPHAYLPFSAGSRNCIGQNFAMNEMKIALAKTLQRYCLYLDEETPEPVMNPTITLQSKHGIFIKLEPLPQ